MAVPKVQVGVVRIDVPQRVMPVPVVVRLCHWPVVVTLVVLVLHHLVHVLVPFREVHLEE